MKSTGSRGSIPSALSSCSHIIRQSKYEQNDPTARFWWYKVFEELEDDAAIMPHDRMDVIERMFPDIKDKLMKILNFRRVYRPDEVDVTDQLNRDLSEDIVGRDEDLTDSNATQYDEYPLGSVLNNARPNNPYRNFFKTRKDRAAIWKVLPPLLLTEMNLTQKAEAVTEQIAQSFYDWLKTMGGDDEPSLKPRTIVKMFEIGFNYHAAHSLCVKIKEMPAVTDTIAEARNLPQASLRYNLHKQLKRDMKAFKTKEKQIAFGKMLPLELRSMPPKEDFSKKWLHCKRVPKDLASMEAVWGGIEHLRSTRAFCLWLANHPEIPPPAYLVERGMLKTDFFKAAHYSADDIAETTSEFVVSQPSSMFK